MKLADAVKPVSYVKAHMAEILRKMGEDGQPVVITQNGEAKAVLLDAREYDRLQQSLAMARILARSSENLRQGLVRPAEEVFADLAKRHGR